MPIKDGYARTDTDGLIYRTEDTEWAVHPSEDGPMGCGVLAPKANAVAVSEEEGTDK